MYPVWTIGSDRKPQPGAEMASFRLRCGIEIPAILVGEEGRGRELGVLPVAGAQPGDVIRAARIGQTRSGRPKLFAAPEQGSGDYVIVVLRTPIGFRGSNDHTGDYCPHVAPKEEVRDRLRYWGERQIGEALAEVGASWGQPLSATQAEKLKEVLRRIGVIDVFSDGSWLLREYLPFPGRWLVTGRIAQGDAGRMGSGTQGVALIPKGKVFRTYLGGRVYGAPRSMYYVWTGEELLHATREERELLPEDHPLALSEEVMSI